MLRSLKPLLACCGVCLALSAPLVARGGAQSFVSSALSLDPFASSARVSVLLFVRTDCPITNRYGPELQRIATEFKAKGVVFWLVYPDLSEQDQDIHQHVSEYGFPGTPLHDPDHRLVRRARVVTAPEAAVFDGAGRLIYHGRIDDRYIDIGKARPSAQVHDLEDAIAAVLAGKPVRHPETRAVGCSLADLSQE